MSNNSKRREVPLVASLKKGDKTALYGLYDMYSGSLYGVILRVVGNEDEAKDLLQETFISIWQKIGSYDETKGRFYTWAYRIAKNASLNRIRSRKKGQFIQIDDSGVYKVTEEEEEMPDFTRLYGLLTQLESHHQEAIRLIYFKGYTHAEAHQIMSVPLGTFKSYVRQALKQLRGGYLQLLVPAALLIVERFYG